MPTALLSVYDKTGVVEFARGLAEQGAKLLSTGGTATDVTDVIHPDNRDMAVRAIKAIGLDVGGVDFLSRDITLSYREIGGGICEINAAPGFRMHVAPSEGTARDAAGPETRGRRRRSLSRPWVHNTVGRTWNNEDAALRLGSAGCRCIRAPFPRRRCGKRSSI